MDALVLILMIIMYLVWQAMTTAGSKQKPRSSSKQPQPPRRERPAAEGSELDDALREIREALGGPAPPQTPREQPRQSPAAPPRRPGREPGDAHRARREELQRQRQQVERETRRYEKQARSAMEKQIERQRELSERVAAAERRAENRDPAMDEPLKVERRSDRSRRTGTSNRLAERFFDPESLQEAIVMNEILGPPRARPRGERR